VQIASSGGRRLEYAAVVAGRLALEEGRKVTRKELSEAARHAAEANDLRATTRAILSELAGCWGQQDHALDRLIVWPSNEWLMKRTGIKERTIRNAIRELIAKGIIVAKDSANGKRYAQWKDGVVVEAFGFDLTPLYARRGEWLAIKRAKDEQAAECRTQWNLITIARRAVAEALASLAQHFPEADRSEIEGLYSALVAQTPDRRPSVIPAELLQAWENARKMAEEAFYKAGYGGEICRHIESNPESNQGYDKGSRVVENPPPPAVPEPVTLPVLIEACPIIAETGIAIRCSSDIDKVAKFCFANLAAHHSAWDEATRILSPAAAAVVAIYVAQLQQDDLNSGRNRVQNWGGYFRSVVRLIESGKMSIQKELRAMIPRRLN